MALPLTPATIGVPSCAAAELDAAVAVPEIRAALPGVGAAGRAAVAQVMESTTQVTTLTAMNLLLKRSPLIGRQPEFSRPRTIALARGDPTGTEVT